MPGRLTRPNVVAVVPSFDHLCQSRKNRHLSPQPSYRPAPAAPVGLPTHSPEDRKNDAHRIALSDFLRVERWDRRTLHGQCTIERHHTPCGCDKEYIHRQWEALSCFCDSFYLYCIQIRYLGDCHQYAICYLYG